MKALCIACFTALSLSFNSSGEQFRTDINPALLYYQAFLLAPNFEQAENDFLFDARGWKLPERFGELVGRYDAQLSLVRRAAQETVPCDWGIDMSAGPLTLLPHLARAKAVVQGARLRAMWDLQQGRPADASDNLLAALVLARNVPRQGTLIAVLVQIAMEAIICTTVAENLGQFPAETLKQLLDGFEAAPARSTVAGSIPLEKSSFHEWTYHKILELQRLNPQDDAKVLDEIRRFMGVDAIESDGSRVWERVTKAAGGTSEGILKLLRDRDVSYETLGAIMALPYTEYQRQREQFWTESEKSPNPFISLSFSGFEKAREREFRILATLEMVRVTVEYKLHGEAGLQKVADPCGNGPFAFRRFVFQGVDRGFELKSAYDLGGDPGVLIFVEKDGPPFRVSGPQVGKAFVKENAEDAFRKRYGLDRTPAPAK